MKSRQFQKVFVETGKRFIFPQDYKFLIVLDSQFLWWRYSSYLLAVEIQRFGTAWGARDDILTFAYSAVPFRASSVSYKQRPMLSKTSGSIWCWMGSHFHNWIDYNEVTFLVELLEWGLTFSRFLGWEISGKQEFKNRKIRG